MSVPNQKIIQIAKRRPYDSNNIYGMAHIDAMKKASKELSGVAYKLWCAFNSNQNDRSFELSQVAMEKEWGIKKTSYYKAIDELVEFHYLAPVKEGSNVYMFFEDGVHFQD